jgi:malonyl-CoA decarboxylase
MVNYLYDLDDIEKNHEAYAGGQRVVASSAVRRLLRGASAELVPVAG